MSALAPLSPQPRAPRRSKRKARTAPRSGRALGSPHDAPLMHGHERIMPKLTVSQPHDPLEAEADRVADRVMRGAEPGSASSTTSHSAAVQRKCAQCDTDEESNIQRKADGASARGRATPGFDSSLSAARSTGGSPLPASTRRFLEPRFGTNFSQVRVHNNSRASSLAESINARAFTVGSDLFFKKGEFNPESSRGKWLIAHELAHVVQTRNSSRPMLRKKLDKCSPDGPSLESNPPPLIYDTSTPSLLGTRRERPAVGRRTTQLCGASTRKSARTLGDRSPRGPSRIPYSAQFSKNWVGSR